MTPGGWSASFRGLPTSRLEGVVGSIAVTIGDDLPARAWAVPASAKAHGPTAGVGPLTKGRVGWMPYGLAGDYSCEMCLDSGEVTVECDNDCNQGSVVISADGDLGLCGTCGGTGTVERPCNHSLPNREVIYESEGARADG